MRTRGYLMVMTYTAGTLLGSSVFAQTPASDEALDEIVVTGSRLDATGFATPTPVTVLGAEQLEQRAPAALSEVLNEMPSFAPTGRSQSTRTVTNPGGGQATANLRALGSQRTLTLIDGHRQIGSSQTSWAVDTNRIPTAMIQRIDVVTGGASAAYGSDAVAGVLNVIMNDKLTGITGTVQHGRSEHGDARDTALNLAFGTDYAGDRGHVVIGGDWSDDGGVGNILSRPWGRREPGVIGTGSPNTTYAYNVETANATPGSLITSVSSTASPLYFQTFGAGGARSRFNRGTTFSNGALMTGSQANYGIAPLISFQLLNPIKRYNIMARTHFDISDNLTLLGDVNYSHLHTNGEIVINTQSYIINRTNPFLPASVLADMVATGVQTITLGQVPTDFGPPTADTTTKTLQFNGGLKGSFADWNWDANYGYGRTNTEFRVLNQPQLSNLAAAVGGCDTTSANPNFTTTTLTKTPSKVMPGCVPYNPFGVGVNSQAALDYVRQTAHNEFTIYMHDVAANLRGSLFTLPAGEVKFATGAEWRRESMFFVSSDVSKMVALNIGNGLDLPTVSRTVYEGYTEFGVPLLKDLPGVHALDLNAAYRYTHYSNSGSVNTWKMGLVYEPVQSWRLRATKSRDIRAPNLSDLFSRSAPSAVNATFINPFPNGGTQVLVGQASGNPTLQPEIADSFTAGVVFQPAFLRSLSVSVDYYKIELEGVITQLSADVTVNRCISTKDPIYCNNITFVGANQASQIALVQTIQRNLNVRTAEGFDIELSYKPDISAMGLPGTLSTRLLVNLNKEQILVDSAGVKQDAAGTADGSPKWAANLAITYALDRFSLTNQVRGFSKIRGSDSLIGPGDAGYNPNVGFVDFAPADGGRKNTTSKNTWPSRFYWNLGASYDLINAATTKMQVFFNVDNVLDSDPPEFAPVAFSINQIQNYDLIGRRYKAGVRFHF